MKAEAACQTGAAARAPERRKHRRKKTFWHAQLQTPAGDFECRMMDLSPRGAMIEIDHPVAQGQVVTLVMGSLGDFTGIVAWCRDGLLGVQISEYRTPRAQITLPRWVADGEAALG